MKQALDTFVPQNISQVEGALHIILVTLKKFQTSHSLYVWLCIFTELNKQRVCFHCLLHQSH